MKQRLTMVVCVVLGAALVMMCDTDAVQDMVDGEEASATDTPSGPTDDGTTAGSGGTSAETQALIDALTSQVEALESRVAALESASSGGGWFTQTSELADISCPPESVLVVGDADSSSELMVSCRDRETRSLHGPLCRRKHDGAIYTIQNYHLGLRHGLDLWWSSGSQAEFNTAYCNDMGVNQWTCDEYGTPTGGNNGKNYYCTTQEEAEALVAEHGCP